jgi:very-short-patch-repair endonuclease
VKSILESFLRAVDDTAPRPRAQLAHIGEDVQFPFEAWARGEAYPYRREWLPILTRCGSAAEVFFLRPFLERPDVAVHEDGSATAAGLTVSLQHQVHQYAVDVLVRAGSFALAIEIDGMAFHHRSKEQVAADYSRQRRIVARGYTVIRYTAAEVFGDAAECWRQIDVIVARRTGP